MNTAALSAFAALGGSALGGITPLMSNYLIQRGLTSPHVYRDIVAYEWLKSHPGTRTFRQPCVSMVLGLTNPTASVGWTTGWLREKSTNPCLGTVNQRLRRHIRQRELVESQQTCGWTSDL
jgi:hypothetical protein